jgi:hypothetical protein
MNLGVNDADVEVDDRHAKTPLLSVLRDALGLTDTRRGGSARVGPAWPTGTGDREASPVGRRRAGGLLSL